MRCQGMATMLGVEHTVIEGMKLEQVGTRVAGGAGAPGPGHARHRRRRPVDPRRGRPPRTQAVICLDDFHVVAWATAALDAVRQGTWNQLRATNDTAATSMKNTRCALRLLTHRAMATTAPTD